MTAKETDARIRIDKMLIEAGWKLPAWAKEEEINVKTEINNASGEADYVLLSSKENHLCTIEAKKTLLSPLVGKEQARGYANSLSCRFIILSNGILILKLINIKNSETTIDIENELKKAINYERNRQLNQYSKIYYNKIKKNLDFNG